MTGLPATHRAGVVVTWALMAVSTFVAAAMLFGWWGISAWLSVVVVAIFIHVADSRPSRVPSK